MATKTTELEQQATNLRDEMAAAGHSISQSDARCLVVTGYVAALEALGRADLAAEMRVRFAL